MKEERKRVEASKAQILKAARVLQRPTWLVFQSVSSEAAIVVNWWAPFHSERLQTRVDYI